jgi:hypothetical protein
MVDVRHVEGVKKLLAAGADPNLASSGPGLLSLLAGKKPKTPQQEVGKVLWQVYSTQPA